MTAKDVQTFPRFVRAFRRFGQTLLEFGRMQALSCLFPAVILATLAISHAVRLPGLYRYDLILLVCLATQVWMVRAGLETKDGLKVIVAFHLIGLALELFKVRLGSWSHPEAAWTKVGGVPLYSGFMYASVASYICQAWRRLRLRLVQWPAPNRTVPLGAAIYLNFFTHHAIPDFRWVLIAFLFVVFRKTSVSFEVNGAACRMPMVLSFALIGFFIWVAENAATLLGAWQYPNQRDGWQLVHVGKISSWSLLVIVSVMIVAELKLMKERAERGTAKPFGHDPIRTEGRS